MSGKDHPYPYDQFGLILFLIYVAYPKYLDKMLCCCRLKRRKTKKDNKGIILA